MQCIKERVRVLSHGKAVGGLQGQERDVWLPRKGRRLAAPLQHSHQERGDRATWRVPFHTILDPQHLPWKLLPGLPVSGGDGAGLWRLPRSPWEQDPGKKNGLPAEWGSLTARVAAEDLEGLRTRSFSEPVSVLGWALPLTTGCVTWVGEFTSPKCKRTWLLCSAFGGREEFACGVLRSQSLGLVGGAIAA